MSDEHPRSRFGRFLEWLTPEARDDDWLDPGDDEPDGPDGPTSPTGLAERVAALEAEIHGLKEGSLPAVPE
ncbi:hypothetical protein J4573_01800 [Actinomadura barringtoniae]|uniref:Uncharacterized protein n=1 Tax=Actinomadura barringtoniae TaxID=1427535 RepID=A0A939P5X2_9ACTN|nr:hypothetical protein [Actinomadura barringtoniae]MBO2445813.1 hypothetical protein [Actinomadura barringtoniae]